MKVLACGTGYAAGNIGDDAILAGLVKLIRAAAPDAEVGAILFADTYAAPSRRLIARCWPNSLRGTLEAVRWADFVLLGGGTLIAENLSLSYPIEHCVKLIRVARIFQKPIAAACIGTSDIRSERAGRLLRRYYGRWLDFICVRAQSNLEDCVGLGLPKDRIFVTADATFALVPELRCIAVDGAVPSDRIGLNLVSEGLDERFHYVDAVAEVFRQSGMISRVVGFSSESRRSEEADYFVTRSALERAGKTEPQLQFDHLDYVDLVRRLKSLAMVVTMRMHVMIFCAVAGVVCVPIVRERKTRLMADELGIRSVIGIDMTRESLSVCLDRVLADPRLGLPEEGRVDALATRAWLSVDLLRRWFSGEIGTVQAGWLARATMLGALAGWVVRVVMMSVSVPIKQLLRASR